MGLGLRGIAKVKTGLFGFIKGSMIDRLHSIARQGEIFAERHGIATVYRSGFKDKVLQISFHPAEQNVEFALDGQAIIVSAKTSSAGPGYHAFLIDWLDYLAEQMTLDWRFEDDGSGEFCDETGYFNHRDFAMLQDSMRGHLDALADWVLNSEGSSFALSMPIGFNIDADYFALNSLGYWDRSFFEQPDPERFFPWWQQGATAETIRNIALCKMWVDFPWHPTKDDAEGHELRTIVGLVEQSKALGATPLDESYMFELSVLKEVSTLLAGDTSRIGFKRQLMRRPTTGGWSLVLPGYYYDGFNEEGTTASFWYDDREVYMTSFRLDPPNLSLEWPEDEGKEVRFRFENNTFRAVIYLQDKIEGKTHKRLCGRYQSFGTKALVSVIFENDADLAWAETVLRSVDLEARALKPEFERVSSSTKH